ncbi:MAG: helix-turn-helix domain-containing protein [Chloroflexi bacterium]|nr:helix-turn-helix domain-containing protein [Chloroflexota bacterium]
MTPRLLTIPQVAHELGVSPNTVYRLIAAGHLSTVDVGMAGRSRTRVSEAALERFVRSRTTDRRPLHSTA